MTKARGAALVALVLLAVVTRVAIVASALQIEQGNVEDLNTWSQDGPAGNGNWVVTDKGDKVEQTINGEPTFFVSAVPVIGKTIEGTIAVASGAGDVSAPFRLEHVPMTPRTCAMIMPLSTLTQVSLVRSIFFFFFS